MHHPGSVGDYPGYNVQCTIAAAFTPHSSPIHPRIAFTLCRPQPVDAGHGCGIRQLAAKHNRVSARVDTVRSRPAARSWRVGDGRNTDHLQVTQVTAVCKPSVH